MAERLVYVRGEVDMETAPALRKTLDDAIARDDSDLRFDCRDLTFIDSKGLAVLIEAQRALQARGRSLRIVNPSTIARRVISLVGLDEILQMNEPEALADVADSN